MRKFSRLGWLHGLILLSVAVGCKSSSNCGGGNCGPTSGGPGVSGGPMYSGTAGAGGVGYPKLFASGTATATSQGMSGGQPTYPTAGGPTYPTTGGQTYPATPGGQTYPLPATSSTPYSNPAGLP